MPETLVVRLHDFVVGRLRQGSDKGWVRLDVDTDFDAGQITPTESFTAVPGIEPPSDEVSDFLGGYVPEGHHRLVMASRRGIDSGDLFALLREFGRLLAGALTVQPPGLEHSTFILRPQVPQRACRLVDEHYGHLMAQVADCLDSPLDSLRPTA